jgi:hypothetical protein
MYLARAHGVRLVTFDQGIAQISPWTESLLLLTTSAHARS